MKCIALKKLDSSQESRVKQVSRIKESLLGGLIREQQAMCIQYTVNSRFNIPLGDSAKKTYIPLGLAYVERVC